MHKSCLLFFRHMLLLYEKKLWILPFTMITSTGIMHFYGILPGITILYYHENAELLTQ